MTTTSRPSTQTADRDHDLEGPRADALERLVAAGIGITARAIGESPNASTLTLAQWRVLVIAARSPGVRIGELAGHLGISVPSASRLVRRIEARHLISTERGDDDRRATVVDLTDAGRRLVNDVIARRRDLIRMVLRDWPRGRDPEAITLVAEISDRLTDFA